MGNLGEWKEEDRTHHGGQLLLNLAPTRFGRQHGPLLLEGSQLGGSRSER